MFPTDYERYMKESMEFEKNHIVLSCPNYFYKWVFDDSNIPIGAKRDIPCPSYY